MVHTHLLGTQIQYLLFTRDIKLRTEQSWSPEWMFRIPGCSACPERWLQGIGYHVYFSVCVCVCVCIWGALETVGLSQSLSWPSLKASQQFKKEQCYSQTFIGINFLQYANPSCKYHYPHHFPCWRWIYSRASLNALPTLDVLTFKDWIVSVGTSAC